MTTATETKTVTESQMAWMLNNRMAWTLPGESDDVCYTSKFEYIHIPTHLDRDGNVIPGHYIGR